MKRLENGQRVAFAGLVDAMARRSPDDVAAGLTALGIVVEDVVHGKTKPKSKRKTRRDGRNMRRADGDSKASAMVSEISSTVRDPKSSPPKWANFFGRQLVASARPMVDSLPSSNYQEPRVVPDPQRSVPTLTSAEKLAYTMFDTAEYEGVSSNPFSDESALRSATVTELPKELFFLLRTMQIMRGICAATGNADFSLAKSWAPVARTAVKLNSDRG